MAAVAPEERMRLAAGGHRAKVLNAADRCLPTDLRTLLGSADIYWRDITEEAKDSVMAEAERFEAVLAEAGVKVVPRIPDSLGRAISTGSNKDLTLRFDEAQIEAAEPELRETLLDLSAWSPGAAPARVFATGSGRARVADAAEGLCLICVPREGLDERHRSRTFDLAHLIAPQLSPERLEMVERCLSQAEDGRPSEGAVRPGLTGSEEIAIVPLWPDPRRPRQLWAVAAESSWVFAAPVERLSEGDAERLVERMVPRWRRAKLPEHGAALGGVLVEVAIDSASRRAQALGGTAEAVFEQGDEQLAQEALNRLGSDLAELNAGLDELEVAAADSRADLTRRVLFAGHGSEEAWLYELLLDSLDEALDKLDRQQQRLQGSFLAAREHASSLHVAATVRQLEQQQKEIRIGQEQTEKLNSVVGALAVVLLGPTILFGALSITDYWLPHSEYLISVAVVLLYVAAGLGLSVAIGSNPRFFARLFVSAPGLSDQRDRDRGRRCRPGSRRRSNTVARATNAGATRGGRVTGQEPGTAPGDGRER